jgi:ABC-type Na+ efflux pump permease subunit
MKIVLLVLIGLMLGLLGGAVIGVGAGLAWVSVFHTSDFEGYSGMLVFFTFMPIGSIVGGLAGAIGLGMVAGQKPAPAENTHR